MKKLLTLAAVIHCKALENVWNANNMYYCIFTKVCTLLTDTSYFTLSLTSD